MLRLVRRVLATLIPKLGGIPRGTQVDPSHLPEDEFPIQCLRCGYGLRGLPDGHCPECGERFSRGHLLVELYVRCRRPRTDKRARISRLLTIYFIVTLAAMPLARGALLLGIEHAPEATCDVIFHESAQPWWVVASFVMAASPLA